MNNTHPQPARGQAKLDSEKKGLYKVTIFDKSFDLHYVTNMTINR